MISAFPFVFVSERGSPFTAAAGAGLEGQSHTLPHACGYALTKQGQDTRAIQGWLGHRAITNERRSGTANWPLCGADKRPSGRVPAKTFETKDFNVLLTMIDQYANRGAAASDRAVLASLAQKVRWF